MSIFDLPREILRLEILPHLNLVDRMIFFNRKTGIFGRASYPRVLTEKHHRQLCEHGSHLLKYFRERKLLNKRFTYRSAATLKGGQKSVEIFQWLRSLTTQEDCENSIEKYHVLSLAAAAGNFDLMKYFLESISFRADNILPLACLSGNKDLAVLLQNRGFMPRAACLFNCIVSNSLDILDALELDNIKVRRIEYPAIYFLIRSIRLKRLNIFKWLIEFFNIQMSFGLLVTECVSCGSFEILEYVLSFEPDEDLYLHIEPSLFAVSPLSDNEILKCLRILYERVPIIICNDRTVDGLIAKGHIESVKFLICRANGISISKDLILVAINYDRGEILKYLLEDIQFRIYAGHETLRNCDRQDLLERAILAGKYNCSKYLILSWPAPNKLDWSRVLRISYNQYSLKRLRIFQLMYEEGFSVGEEIMERLIEWKMIKINPNHDDKVINAELLNIEW